MMSARPFVLCVLSVVSVLCSAAAAGNLVF